MCIFPDQFVATMVGVPLEARVNLENRFQEALTSPAFRLPTGLCAYLAGCGEVKASHPLGSILRSHVTMCLRELTKCSQPNDHSQGSH